MIVLIGKTCSGKDTIKQKLTEKGFHTITTYTTRPKRNGEKQDVTYHFISKDDFKTKIQEGFFAEYKVYNTEFGEWYYGTSVEDLRNANDDTVVILTPQGYMDILKEYDLNINAIYIYANNSTIKKRLISRGDNKDEAQRRLEHDNEDFKGIEDKVDKIFYNNNGTDVECVVDKIIAYIKNERK